MRLAVVDDRDRVLISWPTVADAHVDLAELLAERVADLIPTPRRFRKPRQPTAIEIAAAVRAHLLDLQHQTIRL